LFNSLKFICWPFSVIPYSWWFKIWETRIPPWLYARFYVSWRRVRREVDILRGVFERYNAWRLVEFGCGIGRHGYLLSKLGFKVLLTDVVDWRFGVSRRLPFSLYDVLEGGRLGVFDGAYALGLLILMDSGKMVRALNNMALNVRNGGVLVFDYNFTTYNEPREVTVRARGKTFKALMRWEDVKPVEGGIYYRYRVEVVDEDGRVVGVEDTGYPVYTREAVMKVIGEAGLELVDVKWVRWNPEKYVYEPAEGEADSAFIVLRKPPA